MSVRSAVAILCALLAYGCGQSLNARLEEAIEAGRAADAATLLHEGADPDYRNWNRRSMLELALRAEHYDIAEILIKSGANPLTRIDGVDVLIGVAGLGKKCPPNVVRALLDAGHGPSTTQLGETPLDIALTLGGNDCAHVLIAGGADVHVVNSIGLTTLHSAAGGSSSNLVALLLDTGIPVDAAAVQGTTPLMMAAVRKSSDPESDRVVTELLGRGANPCLRNKHGASAADLARQRGESARADSLEALCRGK